MTDLEQRSDMATDPVCGMAVDPARAQEQGLTAEHAGEPYYFCGRGCMLDFKENPAKYFDPDYVPSM